MKLFTTEQMRAFDRAASEKFGVPSLVLMENAALRVVEFLEMQFAPLAGKRIVVLCGKGNNGGDGLAIARHLAASRCDLSVVLARQQDYKGDALANYRAWMAENNAGNERETPRFYTVEWPELASLPADECAKISRQILGADILVDALLGTGFSGELRPPLDSLLYDVYSSRAARVAVDVPSGLSADSGIAAANLPSGAGQAHFTVTFAAPKRGFFLRDGLERCGEIWVGGIGTPPAAMHAFDTRTLCLTRRRAQRLVPSRALDAHKGDAGRVLVIGGSLGLSGAPAMTSRAALRVGAGLVTAALPTTILPIFAASQHEAMSQPLPCDDEGRLTEAGADALPALWKSADAVAIGPGLSRGEGALRLARLVFSECPKPLIIDADALYAVRAASQTLKKRSAPTILTPHPGEMGELMESSAAEVQKDRFGVAQKCAEKFKAIVVLKGARSLVAFPDGRVFVNLSGNAGMATGGSGDALTGTIAGLLAQLKNAEAATLLGVYLHGLAGDLAFAQRGNGLIAGDIIENLPRALVELAQPLDARPNARLRKLE